MNAGFSYVVVKYGGTSLATPEKIRAAALALVARRRRGDKVVAVVSAMGQTTDELVKLCATCFDSPDGDEAATVLVAGEQIAAGLMAGAIERAGGRGKSYLAWQLPLVTDRTGRTILSVDTERLEHDVEAGVIPVVAGYQGIDVLGRFKTLGRGGSDTTAVALASALKARHCEIRTDVGGVFSHDPRRAPGARRFAHLSYERMLSLVEGGAQVLSHDAARLAQSHKVPLWIGDAHSDQPGTWIATSQRPPLSTIGLPVVEASGGEV